MELRKINLNLLVSLDYLLAEQSVTKAARKMFLTQAAMSNNLQQLRNIFKDPLLLREKHRMILTQYAKELQSKLHEVLQELHTLINNGQCFLPHTSQRIFKIGMSDYMVPLVMPKLLIHLEKYAPSIKILIVPLSRLGSAEAFERGDYDLAIGKLICKEPILQSHLLFKDKGVCIVNQHNPLAAKKKITFNDYLNAEHIAIRADTDPSFPSLVEEALTQLGVTRNIKIALPYITPIFKLIEKSECLLSTVMSSMAHLYQKEHNFVIKALPFKMPTIDFYLVWHKRHESDLGHRWLRDYFRDCF